MKLLSPVLAEPLERAGELAEALYDCAENDEEVRGQQFENEVLHQAEVGGVELSGCKLIGCRFVGCSFEKTGFTDVVFENCDLSNCVMNGAVLHRVEFRNCKLVGCAFEEAYLRNVKLENCACGYVAVRHSDVKTVTFFGCDLTGADFFECKLTAVLSDCKLIEAHFYQTPLRATDLTSSEIAGISISPDDLKGAIVTRDQAADLARLLGLVIK